MPSLLPESLMRPIDLSYPSNRWAVGGALGALMLSRLAGKPWPQAMRVGLLSFAAWAVGRELDPDHAATANAALPLAAVLAAFDPPRSAVQAGADVMASGAVLLSLRSLTGSVGAQPGAADQLVLVGVAGGNALTGQRGAALLPALAQGLVETQGQSGAFRVSPQVALAGVLGVLPGVVRSAEAGPYTRLALLGSLLLTTVTARPEAVHSKQDRGNGPVSARRVQLARGAAQATAAVALGLGQASVLGAANLALGLRRLRSGW